MWPRLTEVLRKLGVLDRSEIVDQKVVAIESETGFGSLVRCSLSRLNAKGALECTGQVMPKAFVEEISANLKPCARTYLGDLPPVRPAGRDARYHRRIDQGISSYRPLAPWPAISDADEVS